MKPGGTDPWFSAIQRLVEERVNQALRDGLFDDLPGKGKPLSLDDDSRIEPSLRASYRILRNAGILPPEMQLRREISNLRQLLDEAEDEDQARELVREINEKILASNVVGRFSVTGGMDQVYGEKVLEKIRGRKSRFHLEQNVRGRITGPDRK